MLSLFLIVTVNLLQFILIRKVFHNYKLNHKYTGFFVAECISAVGFVVYNMSSQKLLYKAGTVYFIDIFVTLIFVIPFIISALRANFQQNY